MSWFDKPQPRIPSARPRMIRGEQMRQAMVAADEVERDLRDRTFDCARYTGNLFDVIEVLRQRNVIHRAHPEDLQRHGVDWHLSETFVHIESGDLLRLRRRS